MPENQLVSYIKEHGITFHPDEEDLKSMKGEGLSDAGIDAIRKAQYHEPTGTGHANYQKAAAQTTGDPDKAFTEAEITSEGLYGSAVIAQCCMGKPWVQSEWTIGPQHVSTSRPRTFGHRRPDGGPLETRPATSGQDGPHRRRLRQQVRPRPLGHRRPRSSRSKAGGKPVKIMLERDAEQTIAGIRPSMYGKVKIGAKKDGTITAWHSEAWGTGGLGGGGRPPLPYVFEIPNRRKQHTPSRTTSAARAPGAPRTIRRRA